MVIWSEIAYEDLEAIFEYISHDSIAYAKRVIEKILDKGDELQYQPESGRTIPNLKRKDIEHFREIYVYSYRIIYEFKDDNIIIHTVIHGKRDLPSAFNKEPETPQ